MPAWVAGLLHSYRVETIFDGRAARSIGKIQLDLIIIRDLSKAPNGRECLFSFFFFSCSKIVSLQKFIKLSLKITDSIYARPEADLI